MLIKQIIEFQLRGPGGLFHALLAKPEDSCSGAFARTVLRTLPTRTRKFEGAILRGVLGRS